MILVDANLLLYAKVDYFPEHQQANRWLNNILISQTRFGIPWESINAFIRISTNPRIFELPLDIRSAWQQIMEWTACPGVWIPTPNERHQEILDELIPHCRGSPGLIHDAHLAAIAISHGLTIYSADGDFARFPNLRWVNPCRDGFSG